MGSSVRCPVATRADTRETPLAGSCNVTSKLRNVLNFGLNLAYGRLFIGRVDHSLDGLDARHPDTESHSDIIPRERQDMSSSWPGSGGRRLVDCVPEDPARNAPGCDRTGTATPF